MKKLIWLTGASGVGKTTLLNNLKEKYQNQNWEFLKFDSIGVPSNEDMVKDYGSGENWQRAKTYEWIQQMVNGYPNKKVVIMDGQANMDFIIQGFKDQGFSDYQIILVDCDQETMVKRLTDLRQQAWLASQDMKNWLAFLRKQAQEYQISVIDTTQLTPNEILIKFEKIFNINL